MPLSRISSNLARLIALSTRSMTTVVFAPMRNMDVEIQSDPLDGSFIRTTTDADGYLRLLALCPGRYVVSDALGHRTPIEHDGGPALWRLLGSDKGPIPEWSLVDASS